jgi:hypothetical protein
MRFQPSPRRLSVLAGALTTAGIALAVGGCGNVTPLGPDPASASLPPPRHLGSPIIVQVMRTQPPAPSGRCPAGSVDLFGSDPNVPRAAVAAPQRAHPVHTSQPSTASPAAAPTRPPATPVGVACYFPVGRRITITSAAVSSVTTSQNHPGPGWYEFVVAFPAADVPALTALIGRAYDSGDALGMSVAGKLWQASRPRHMFIALRGEQVNLLSRAQAVQLHRLLVPAG